MSEERIKAKDEGANGSDDRKIPRAVVKRLSLYRRVLQSMEFVNVEKVSSAELARRLGLNSAQVRKDLALFGQFGVPGFGYRVDDLKTELKTILGKDRQVRVILVGVGNLGSALMSYGGFMKHGFTMLWGFDVNPDAARKRVHDVEVPIYDIQEMETRLVDADVDIAVLSVPIDVAQEITDRLVKIGINAILNFVPMRLETPPGIQVRYVDLSLELESLSYYLKD